MTQFHKPKKGLGQNFLVDTRIARQIVDSVVLDGAVSIVEIGAGHGALTEPLMERAQQLIALELDRDLIGGLRQRFCQSPKFQIIEADALNFDFCSLVATGRRMSIVANLPYDISTPILQRLIEQRGCISELVLMLQREVIDRITAQPGNSDRGYFSVLVQAYCEVEPLFDVPPTAFKPVPKVWSSVARFRFRENPIVEPEHESFFKTLLSAAFAQKRKTILNNLKASPPALRQRLDGQGGIESILGRAQLETRARAESLSQADWQRLLRIICAGTD